MMCTIRKWRVEDAAELAEVLNNKKIHDNVRDGLPFPYTEDDAADFINSMLQTDENVNMSFAIIVDDKVVGSVGVHRKDNVHRLTAEIGYYVAEPYWGKGVVTSAVKQVCDWAFENTDLVRIFAETYAHNIASCRVVEKCGFQLEGTLRCNAIKNGKILDMKLYSLIK